MTDTRCRAVCDNRISMFPVKFAFEDVAAKWWLEAANEIANGKLTALYWRHEPEWELEKRSKSPVGASHAYGIVYSRFVTE